MMMQTSLLLSLLIVGASIARSRDRDVVISLPSSSPDCTSKLEALGNSATEHHEKCVHIPGKSLGVCLTKCRHMVTCPPGQMNLWPTVTHCRDGKSLLCCCGKCEEKLKSNKRRKKGLTKVENRYTKKKSRRNEKPVQQKVMKKKTLRKLKFSSSRRTTNRASEEDEVATSRVENDEDANINGDSDDQKQREGRRDSGTDIDIGSQSSSEELDETEYSLEGDGDYHLKDVSKVDSDGERKKHTREFAVKTSRGRSCRDNIMIRYPGAECLRTADKDECRDRCGALGSKKCAGRKGEVHKLNCKGEASGAVDGKITCCCSIACESAETVRDRLNGEFASFPGKTLVVENNNMTHGSPLCVEASRDKIKSKLAEVCSTRDEVFVARKYCMEELGGAYFCVKNGHCFGRLCKGCIHHECEDDQNQKLSAEPPKHYFQERMRLRDFDTNVAVNVDDMDDNERLRQWCTSVNGRKTCADTCREFGDRVCRPSIALKYDHDYACKRNEPRCQCCCQPVCKGRSQPDSLLRVSTEADEDDEGEM